MRVINLKRVKGITLIELMIVIAIAAILISIAAPNLTASIQNNRMVTQVNELHAALSLARTEAVKRNGDITICSSSNGSSCSDTGAWEDGWIVFVDNDSDGIVDDGEDILRVHGALRGSNSLAFSQTFVTYINSGLASDGLNSTFTLCDSRGAASAMGLVIGSSGRARLATDSDENGTLEDRDGTDLECSS